MIDMIGVPIFEPFPLNLCWSLSFLWPSPGQTPTKWLRISWSVARRAPYSDDVFLPSVIRGLGGLAAWLSQKPLVSELWPKNELQNVADTSDTLTMQSYAAIILRHSPTRATQDARAGCGKAGAAKSSLGTADSRHWWNNLTSTWLRVKKIYKKCNKYIYIHFCFLT